MIWQHFQVGVRHNKVACRASSHTTSQRILRSMRKGGPEWFLSICSDFKLNCISGIYVHQGCHPVSVKKNLGEMSLRGPAGCGE